MNRHERLNNILDSSFSEGEIVDQPDLNRTDRLLREQNERVWAHYTTGAASTQAEAAEQAGGLVKMSQSTASRVIRDMDQGVFTAPVRSLSPPGESESEFKTLTDVSPEYIETYRHVVANAIVDLRALAEFIDGQRETPEWARERFPNLDPDLGERFYSELGIPTEREIRQEEPCEPRDE